jgi:hypothetical protein
MDKCCKNCKTNRFPIRVRGLCSRCYSLILKKEKGQRWDINNQSSLKSCPFISDSVVGDSQLFNEYRKIYIEIINNRLRYLQTQEQIFFNGPVTGSTLEYMFGRLAAKTGIKDPKIITHGMATPIEDNIDKVGRHFLFRMLKRIEEAIPWYGLSMTQIVKKKWELENERT